MEEEFYNLLLKVEYLTKEEQENWENYLRHKKNQKRQKILDEINQLGFRKRELEKQIIEKCRILDNADKMLVGVSV